MCNEGEEFMFQLTKEEWEMFTKASPLPINEDNNTSSFTDNYNLRSQIVTSRFSDKWGGNRRPPYAFSEIGVAMLSSVLKSEVAIQANRKIMKAFVAYRHLAELPLAVHSRNRPYCVILSRHYRGFSMTLEGFSVRVEGIDLQDAVADRA